MTRVVYHIDVDRVVVAGCGVEIGSSELRELVGAAVTREMAGATLPGGRMMRASVRLTLGSARATDGPAVAGAIARGVSSALKGRSHG